MNAYLPAFEEFEGSADVGNPVNPLQLAALLRGLNKGQTVKIMLANQYKAERKVLIQLFADLKHGKKLTADGNFGDCTNKPVEKPSYLALVAW